MYNIISDDESWIYWQDKRQSSDWVFPGEENLTEVIRLRSVSKKMVWTFVSKADHVALLPLQDHRTVTTDCYATICLPKVIAKLWKTNPNWRIIIHQNNASLYSSQDNWIFPYSPDLNPNDFFTFPGLKVWLYQQRNGITASRIQRCINLLGKYF